MEKSVEGTSSVAAEQFLKLCAEGATEQVIEALSTVDDPYQLINAAEGGGIDISQPLRLAAWKGHTEIVSALLQAGSEVDAPDSNGWTALFYAAYGGRAAAATALLAGGARADARSAAPCRRVPRGARPADVAEQKGDTELLMLLKTHMMMAEEKDQAERPPEKDSSSVVVEAQDPEVPPPKEEEEEEEGEGHQPKFSPSPPPTPTLPPPPPPPGSGGGGGGGGRVVLGPNDKQNDILMGGLSSDQQSESKSVCTTSNQKAQDDVSFSWAQRASGKVRLQFKAVGNAPIMKKNKFLIGSHEKFQQVMVFLRNQLKLPPTESLFLYINGAFAPSPDQTISSLYECFQIQGELILNYSIVGAWG